MNCVAQINDSQRLSIDAESDALCFSDRFPHPTFKSRQTSDRKIDHEMMEEEEVIMNDRSVKWPISTALNHGHIISWYFSISEFPVNLVNT